MNLILCKLETIMLFEKIIYNLQKRQFESKRCSKNIQKFHAKIPMDKHQFNEGFK